MSDDQWRRDMEARMGRMDVRMNTVEKAGAVAEVVYDNINRRLGSMEGTLVWIVRLIIGAMILAITGFAMSGGFSV